MILSTLRALIFSPHWLIFWAMTSLVASGSREPVPNHLLHHLVGAAIVGLGTSFLVAQPLASLFPVAVQELVIPLLGEPVLGGGPGGSEFPTLSLFQRTALCVATELIPWWCDIGAKCLLLQFTSHGAIKPARG